MSRRGLVLSASILIAVCGASCSAEKSQETHKATTTIPTSTKLDGQQTYKSAQQLADELTRLGHRCDLKHDRGGYFDDSGRCNLGGDSGPETILVTFSSPSEIDRYFSEVPNDDYAWLFGKDWGINCHDGEPTLCDELQSQLGGTVKRSPAPIPDTRPAPTDAQVKAAFQAYIDERASGGVMLAQAVTSVAVKDGVVTVAMNPTPIALELSPFDNLAEMFGTPVAFNDDDGVWLRKSVNRVDVVDATGKSLGSMTAAELNKKAVG